MGSKKSGKTKSKQPREEIVEGSEPAFKGKLIRACEAVVGEKYLSWNGQDVLSYTGKNKQVYNEERMLFEGWSVRGDRLSEFDISLRHPIVIDPKGVEEVMKSHQAWYAKLNGPRGSKKSGEAVIIREDPETGEVVEVVKKKRVSAPRSKEPKDPRTGCTPGTKGHLTGEILLKVKAGKGHKERAIEAIVKELQLPKTAASMWYMDHCKKRPEIYGKLGN